MMFKRILLSLLVPFVMTATAWAAADPFVGDWKLNTSRSKLIDQMKVKNVSGNTYEFDFGGTPERIVVDGTFQPGVFGSMLSVTNEGPNNWKVMRKKDGRMLLTAKWTLSRDGNILRDNYTDIAPNGTWSTVNYLYKRTANGRGFAGTWESRFPMSPDDLLKIRPYEGSGLSFRGSPQDTRNLTFDSKDYPVSGAGIFVGLTRSARRANARTLEVTAKINGKIIRNEQLEVSQDLRTLTRTVRPVGQREPDVFVFERQ